MKTIKETSKEWCSEHSNKGCKEQCDGCWQVESAFGCEQHNMELAYEAGANYVLDEIEKQLDEFSNLEDSLIVRRVIEELKKKRL